MTASIPVVTVSFKIYSCRFLEGYVHINTGSYSNPTRLFRQGQEFEDTVSTRRSFLIFIFVKYAIDCQAADQLCDTRVNLPLVDKTRFQSIDLEIPGAVYRNLLWRCRTL